jgi:hypothetical protein
MCVLVKRNPHQEATRVSTATIRAITKVLARKHDEIVPQIIAAQSSWRVARLGRQQRRIKRLIAMLNESTKKPG